MTVDESELDEMVDSLGADGPTGVWLRFFVPDEGETAEYMNSLGDDVVRYPDLAVGDLYSVEVDLDSVEASCDVGTTRNGYEEGERGVDEFFDVDSVESVNYWLYLRSGVDLENPVDDSVEDWLETVCSMLEVEFEDVLSEVRSVVSNELADEDGTGLVFGYGVNPIDELGELLGEE